MSCIIRKAWSSHFRPYKNFLLSKRSLRKTSTSSIYPWFQQRSRWNVGVETISLCEIECKHCHFHFYICQSCFHGQHYCSTACRTISQKQAHCKAQQKYRQTDKGRESHRQGETRRRALQNQNNSKTVDDRGTTTPCRPIKLYETFVKKTPRCHFCGAPGVVVSYFPLRGYGSRQKITSPIGNGLWMNNK